MSDKLGFTFYPKDWWTSESYFELTPIQRYYYLECLFIMYSNDGYMKTQKTQFENRTRTQVLQKDWDTVVSRFELLNEQFTHVSVNKRLRKTIANRENGKKGGRPIKEIEKPKKPNLKTQKNPPLEREREREIEINKSIFNELIISESWIEINAKNNKISKEDTKAYLKKFDNQLIAQMDKKNNKKEYTSHFARWLGLEVEKDKNNPKSKFKPLL